MLPLAIIVHNTNATTQPSDEISLTHLIDRNYRHPVQPLFNRHARIPSFLSNIAMWLIFFLAIGVLQTNSHVFNPGIKIIYGLTMLMIIIICYIFILFESKGCIEQLLLKRRVQIDTIKRELGLLQKNPKLINYLTVTATNYYNTLRQKWIDYQSYDESYIVRLQSFFYRNIRLIETPFNVRQHYIDVADFSIDTSHLCQIHFEFNTSIIGRDAHIVQDDIEHEFIRIERKLLQNDDIDSLVKFARITRTIRFIFTDIQQQQLLMGERRTCLVYDNKTNIYGRWFLTENIFWIMTCFGMSWLFRVLFACLIRQIIVPIKIELEGAMPIDGENISGGMIIPSDKV